MQPARRRGRDRRRLPAARHRHVDPPHRPRGLQPVPGRRQAAATCSSGVYDEPERSRDRRPRRCTRSSPTAAAASRSRSRPGSCASPTRSTWRRAARACPFESGRPNIHSLSAAAIEEVQIEPGEEKAVRIEIDDEQLGGHLPGRRAAGDQAARLGRRGADRGASPGSTPSTRSGWCRFSGSERPLPARAGSLPF